MIVGTAGFTAMLAIDRLESLGLEPASGEVLVTGAAGGVGSIAIALLKRLGYQAVGLSGRPEHADHLLALGAASVLDRAEFLEQPDKPLESARWAAVIDNVGGKVLGKVLRQVKYGGSVAAIGNAGGIGLDTNVLPFILRGVALLGMDSVTVPIARRRAIWDRLATDLRPRELGQHCQEVTLDTLDEALDGIVAGSARGRWVVRIGG